MKKRWLSPEYRIALDLQRNDYPQPVICHDQVWYLDKRRMYCTAVLRNRAYLSSMTDVIHRDVYNRINMVYVPKAEEVLQQLGKQYTLKAKGKQYTCTDTKTNTTYTAYTALKATTKAYIIKQQNDNSI